jgi:hypothetical protein
MSIYSRLSDLERRLFRFGDPDDGPLQREYCSWAPHEAPPDVPPGTWLTPATERVRREVMEMNASVPRYAD